MHLAAIFRYPIKGLTPESLGRTRLKPGTGLPFDRVCAFTSGNLPDRPHAGGWVPARTFLQMTVYPELARFRSRLDDSARTIAIISPDGEKAAAEFDDPSSFEDVNRLLRRHFAGGPHGAPALHVQAPGCGHWDFTDTAVSICNLASVRALEKAAGVALDPRRFRSNLYVDGLKPWAEFGLVGRRLRIGKALVEVLRPAMRCAATCADPDTGDTSINVPVLMRKTVGHIFCAVYARVLEGGAIALDEPVKTLRKGSGDPTIALPPRAPDPREWPRTVVFEGKAIASPLAEWPLIEAAEGDVLRVHPGGAYAGGLLQLAVASTADGRYRIVPEGPLASLKPGAKLVVTGPHRRG